MIAEGNETPGPAEGPGWAGAEGPQRPGEGDLLAERRARRAAESGEQLLSRRVQTAEATARALEAQVESLQQRLREATDRAAGEQESNAEVEHLRRLLKTSEADSQSLAQRLERVRQELADAERAAADEREQMRGSERELQQRLTALERRAFEIHRGLESERAARQRAERQLERMRRGLRAIEAFVSDLRGVLARLRVAAGAAAGRAGPPAAVSGAGEQAGRAEMTGADEQAGRTEMAEALAAAVTRLRTRASEGAGSEVSPQAGGSVMAPPAAVPAQQAPRAPEVRPAPRDPLEPPRYKHSMSLLGRWRLALARRRRRRRQAKSTSEQ